MKWLLLFMLMGSWALALDQPPTITVSAAAVPAVVTAKTAKVSVTGADDGGVAGLTYTWLATGVGTGAGTGTGTGTGAGTVTFNPNATNAAKTSTATFSAPGDYICEVTVTDQSNHSQTSSVTVRVNSTVTTLYLSPTTAVVNPDHTKPFIATVKNQFGTVLTGEPLVWSATGAGSVDQAGVFTAGTTPGTSTVTVVDGVKATTATIRVNAAPTVDMASVTDVTGLTASLSASGSDPDHAATTIAYMWSATGPKAVTFSPNGTNASARATATFSSSGVYQLAVIAKDPAGLVATTSRLVTVIATPTTIAVAPNVATTVVNPSGPKTFTASVKDQFKGAMVGTAVAWSVDPVAAGTISSTGVFTGGAPGPAFVSATVGSVIGRAPIRINEAPTVQAAVSTTAEVPFTGTTAVFSVQGTDDINPLLLSYVWTATGPKTVAFVPRSGVNVIQTTATFSQVGTYNIIATMKDQQSLAATSTLPFVIGPITTSAGLTPATAVLKVATTKTFTVQMRDQFAAAITGAVVPAGVQWSVSGVGSITSSGVYSAGAVEGISTISAQILTTPPLTATASVQVVTTLAVATPVIAQQSGVYNAPFSAQVSVNVAGAVVRYRTDGTPAKITDPVVPAGGVPITRSMSLSVIATAPGRPSSAYVTANYTLQALPVVASLATNTYVGPQSVTLSCSTPGATIRYTTDGSIYLQANLQTQSAIPLAGSTTLTAIAEVPGWASSAPQSWVYMLQVPTPTITPSPTSGPFTSPVTVVGNSVDVAATLHVTTDGSTPTNASPVLPNTGMILDRTTTVTVVARRVGWQPSVPVTARFVIIPQVVRADPELAWEPPAPIEFGSPLSAIQLSATAKIGGVFTYEPTFGAILPVGHHDVTVTFTPTDSVHYRVVTLIHKQWIIEKEQSLSAQFIFDGNAHTTGRITITLPSRYNHSSTIVHVSSQAMGVTLPVDQSGDQAGPAVRFSAAGSYQLTVTVTDLSIPESTESTELFVIVPQVPTSLQVDVADPTGTTRTMRLAPSVYDQFGHALPNPSGFSLRDLTGAVQADPLVVTWDGGPTGIGGILEFKNVMTIFEIPASRLAGRVTSACTVTAVSGLTGDRAGFVNGVWTWFTHQASIHFSVSCADSLVDRVELITERGEAFPLMLNGVTPIPVTEGMQRWTYRASRIGATGAREIVQTDILTPLLCRRTPCIPRLSIPASYFTDGLAHPAAVSDSDAVAAIRVNGNSVSQNRDLRSSLTHDWNVISGKDAQSLLVSFDAEGGLSGQLAVMATWKSIPLTVAQIAEGVYAISGWDRIPEPANVNSVSDRLGALHVYATDRVGNVTDVDTLRFFVKCRPTTSVDGRWGESHAGAPTAGPLRFFTTKMIESIEMSTSAEADYVPLTRLGWNLYNEISNGLLVSGIRTWALPAPLYIDSIQRRALRMRDIAGNSAETSLKMYPNTSDVDRIRGELNRICALNVYSEFGQLLKALFPFSDSDPGYGSEFPVNDFHMYGVQIGQEMSDIRWNINQGSMFDAGWNYGSMVEKIINQSDLYPGNVSFMIRRWEFPLEAPSGIPAEFASGIRQYYHSQYEYAQGSRGHGSNFAWGLGHNPGTYDGTFIDNDVDTKLSWIFSFASGQQDYFNRVATLLQIDKWFTHPKQYVLPTAGAGLYAVWFEATVGSIDADSEGLHRIYNSLDELSVFSKRYTTLSSLKPYRSPALRVVAPFSPTLPQGRSIGPAIINLASSWTQSSDVVPVPCRLTCGITRDLATAHRPEVYFGFSDTEPTTSFWEFPNSTTGVISPEGNVTFSVNAQKNEFIHQGGWSSLFMSFDVEEFIDEENHSAIFPDWLNFVGVKNDVISSGSTSRILIEGGFWNTEYSPTTFDPNRENVIIRNQSGVQLSQLAIGATTPETTTRIFIKKQRMLNPTTLELTLSVGADVEAGLCDIDVNMGAVHAYSDELSQQYAGANGSHRMKGALAVYGLKVNPIEIAQLEDKQFTIRVAGRESAGTVAPGDESVWIDVLLPQMSDAEAKAEVRSWILDWNLAPHVFLCKEGTGAFEKAVSFADLMDTGKARLLGGKLFDTAQEALLGGDRATFSFGFHGGILDQIADGGMSGYITVKRQPFEIEANGATHSGRFLRAPWGNPSIYGNDAIISAKPLNGVAAPRLRPTEELPNYPHNYGRNEKFAVVCDADSIVPGAPAFLADWKTDSSFRVAGQLPGLTLIQVRPVFTTGQTTAMGGSDEALVEIPVSVEVPQINEPDLFQLQVARENAARRRRFMELSGTGDIVDTPSPARPQSGDVPEANWRAPDARQWVTGITDGGTAVVPWTDAPTQNTRNLDAEFDRCLYILAQVVPLGTPASLGVEAWHAPLTSDESMFQDPISFTNPDSEGKFGLSIDQIRNIWLWGQPGANPDEAIRQRMLTESMPSNLWMRSTYWSQFMNGQRSYVTHSDEFSRRLKNLMEAKVKMWVQQATALRLKRYFSITFDYLSAGPSADFPEAAYTTVNGGNYEFYSLKMMGSDATVGNSFIEWLFTPTWWLHGDLTRLLATDMTPNWQVGNPMTQELIQWMLMERANAAAKVLQLFRDRGEVPGQVGWPIVLQQTNTPMTADVDPATNMPVFRVPESYLQDAPEIPGYRVILDDQGMPTSLYVAAGDAARTAQGLGEQRGHTTLYLDITHPITDFLHALNHCPKSQSPAARKWATSETKDARIWRNDQIPHTSIVEANEFSAHFAVVAATRQAESVVNRYEVRAGDRYSPRVTSTSHFVPRRRASVVRDARCPNAPPWKEPPRCMRSSHAVRSRFRRSRIGARCAGIGPRLSPRTMRPVESTRVR